MPDLKLDIHGLDWLSSAAVINTIRRCSEYRRSEDALLDRLQSGAVRSICKSSVHRYGATTFSSNRVSTVPFQEWQHYQPRDSSLEKGEVRMGWTSQVSLPILGLCPIMIDYHDLHFRLDDLIQEFPEASWPRRSVTHAEYLPTPTVADAVTPPSNTVIDLTGARRSQTPTIRRRSTLYK